MNQIWNKKFENKTVDKVEGKKIKSQITKFYNHNPRNKQGRYQMIDFKLHNLNEKKGKRENIW